MNKRCLLYAKWRTSLLNTLLVILVTYIPEFHSKKSTTWTFFQIMMQRHAFSLLRLKKFKLLLKNMRKQRDSEDISTKFLKLCGSLMSHKLSVLLSLCVDSGSYPEYMKTSKVIPKHKIGSQNSLIKYRHIYIICNLNKFWRAWQEVEWFFFIKIHISPQTNTEFVSSETLS